MPQYNYILREREFLRNNEPTYKIGKTTQEPNTRLKGYPKGSEIIIFCEVHDCNHIETILIWKFNEKFKRRHEYGKEYFSGDINEMKYVFLQIVNNNIQQNVKYDLSQFVKDGKRLNKPKIISRNNSQTYEKHNKNILKKNDHTTNMETIYNIIGTTISKTGKQRQIILNGETTNFYI